MGRLGGIFFGLAVVLMMPQAQAAPSFDCAKAGTEVEKAICASADLSVADVALANAYRAILARAPEEAKALLRADQRGWVAHVGKVCQGRWAPKEGGADYVPSCIANAYRQQTAFYEKEALTALPNPYGFLLARQTYRTAPVGEADQIDHLPRIRSEANRFPYFLDVSLKALSASPPAPAGEDALEAENGFKASLVNGRLLILEETTYTFAGGAHGLYGSEFATIDLGRARKLTEGDVFLSKAPWRALLAREADQSLRAIAKTEAWDYEPLTTTDMIKAVADPRRWIFGDGLKIYFGIYEVGPYAIGTPLAQVPYSTLREVLTPGFKDLIGLPN